MFNLFSLTASFLVCISLVFQDKTFRWTDTTVANFHLWNGEIGFFLLRSNKWLQSNSYKINPKIINGTICTALVLPNAKLKYFIHIPCHETVSKTWVCGKNKNFNNYISSPTVLDKYCEKGMISYGSDRCYSVTYMNTSISHRNSFHRIGSVGSTRLSVFDLSEDIVSFLYLLAHHGIYKVHIIM